MITQAPGSTSVLPGSTPRVGTLALLRAGLLAAPAVSRKRKALAFAIATTADVMQIVLWPIFSEGAASPFEDALDVVVGVALLLTLGFSARLAAAIAIELIPGADLFPTWMAVVASIPTLEEPATTPRVPARSDR